MFLLSFPLPLPFIGPEMLSMCLLFCFVVFWILCCVVCEKIKNVDNKKRMLFIDFSSAFNPIIPQQLINKLNLLGLNNSLCNWILDFLTGRPQSVRVGHNTSSTTTLSTGAPQGCALHAADP